MHNIMKPLKKIIFASIIISIALSISTCGNNRTPYVTATGESTATLKATDEVVVPTIVETVAEEETEESATTAPSETEKFITPTGEVLLEGDVIQNKAFAHLEVISDTAFVTAGFTHPDDPTGEVMIEWSLFGWNENELPTPLPPDNVREFNIYHVDVNAQVPVPAYDYYLFVSKNKLKDENGNWVPFFTSESRYGRIAPMNGIWERTGEVTASSAILQTYLTEKPAFDATDPGNLRVPPMGGFAQYHVYRDPNLMDEFAQSGFYPVDDYIQIGTEWRRVYYNFRWTVSGLEPDTKYYYTLETMSSDGVMTRQGSNVSSFTTTPVKDADQPISFVVANCLDPYNTAYSDPNDAAELGLKVFASMLNYAEEAPDFVIMEGDTVYYDGGQAYAPDIGEFLPAEFIRRWLYWDAQYQFENLMYFYQQVPGYWQVDDHDYWANNVNAVIPDGWYIFRNVNPTPGSYGTTGEDAVNYYNDNPYQTSKGDGAKYWRAIRWGQHLEVFIEEGHNLREEQNSLIWGEEQRLWLEQQIRESDATFKIIAVTTPLLGPIIPDNFPQSVTPDKHADAKFRPETELFLNNIKDVDNVFIVTGDRHYKYHSAINAQNYPQLGHFNEFGAGSAASPPHATKGGVPDTEFARVLFSDGEFGASAGYLRVEVSAEEITFKLIRVTADQDNEVVHQRTFRPSFTFLPMLTFRR
jgi:phosphodiesterase/alkaline phosphatase D-like protein